MYNVSLSIIESSLSSKYLLISIKMSWILSWSDEINSPIVLNEGVSSLAKYMKRISVFKADSISLKE